MLEPEIGALIVFVAYNCITWLCLRGKNWSLYRQIMSYVACLFFPIIGWVVIILSKPTGPKCLFCGSLMNPGAFVCATCGREQNRDEALPCPSCGKCIPVPKLRVGANTCPFCGDSFECDE